MKPSYYGKMPEKAFMHKEAKSMAVFKAFKNRVTVLLREMLQVTNWIPLWTGTAKNYGLRAYQGASAISILQEQ